MTAVQGSATVVILDDNNLSTYTDNLEFNRAADPHDITTFGRNSHVYSGGLGDGTIQLTGVYEDVTVTGGPRPIIEPLIGTVVELVHRPEGTGSGKPQDTVDVLVTSYVESAAVADKRRWTADLQMSGDVTTANQSP